MVFLLRLLKRRTQKQKGGIIATVSQMKVEYDIPSGMVDMVNGVVGAMVAAYYKAKGKKSEGRLPIPTQEEVINYVVNSGYRLRIDAVAFFKSKDRKDWKGSDGRLIYNWQKLIDYCVQHGDYSGVTEDPNAPPPPLPTTITKN